jgi:hypothetical protein
MLLRSHIFLVGAALLFGASGASAQITVPALPAPPVETSFQFSVPFALTVSHPCQPGLVLINGSSTLDLTLVKSTDFKLTVRVTGTGTGQEAGSNGLPLANGSLPYTYESVLLATTTFPNGTPAYFGHALSAVGELTRPVADDPEMLEVFTVTVVLDVEYNNGIPTTPVLQTIDVSCK